MLPRACPCTLVLLVILATGMAGCQRPAERAFEFSTDASSRSGLVALEDSVLVGNEAGAFLRLNRAGEPLWRVAFAQEVAARPTVSGNGVIVGTVGGELARLGVADSTARWRRTGEPPVLTDLVSDDTSFYVLEPDGAVRAHALDTGQVRWRRPAPKLEESHIDPRLRLPGPALAGGVVVVALGDAGLVALSTTDGMVRWRQPLAPVLGLTREADTLYVTTRDGRVVALSLSDGTLRWEQKPAALLTSPPTVAQARLWVGAEPSQLLALSLTDGSTVSSTALPAPLVTRLTVYREWLLIPTSGREGRLIALRKPGEPPVFSLRADTPLRTEPQLIADQFFVLGLDGRVLSWTLRPPEP